ncbi:MAG: type I-G CRISPR-associated RAMP protein Csb1/Cas7g [Acidimicrobiales bacterium]
MPKREVFKVPMQPVAGSRFQPTGFPDIGAALFDRPIGPDGWEQCLVLESAQSMANHLEATGWDKAAREPVPVLAGLPYVRVVDNDGEFVTSSRLEAHRLASAFIKDSTLGGRDMKEEIRERLELRDDTPLVGRDIARAVFSLDPMCLVHGVFFAENDKVWPGQPKIARALTSFVEARDVKEVISGGVKRDEVRHSTKDTTGGAKEGYGSVPFHRTEYVAREIEASFVLDLDQLSSYGLPDSATELLATVARWEIRSLLDRGFRPRTACDLEVAGGSVIDALPSGDVLEERLRTLIAESSELLGAGQAVDVVWDRKKLSKSAKKAAEPAEEL